MGKVLLDGLILIDFLKLKYIYNIYKFGEYFTPVSFFYYILYVGLFLFIQANFV